MSSGTRQIASLQKRIIDADHVGLSECTEMMRDIADRFIFQRYVIRYSVKSYH
jgi:hypothetical protein